MVVMLSSIGVPGLNGFVGEFLILIGIVPDRPLVDGRRRDRRDPRRRCTCCGRTSGSSTASPTRTTRRFPELRLEGGPACCCRLIAIIVFTGVYPKPMLDRIEPSVEALIRHVEERTGDGRAPSRRRLEAEE